MGKQRRQSDGVGERPVNGETATPVEPLNTTSTPRSESKSEKTKPSTNGERRKTLAAVRSESKTNRKARTDGAEAERTKKRRRSSAAEAAPNEELSPATNGDTIMEDAVELGATEVDPSRAVAVALRRSSTSMSAEQRQTKQDVPLWDVTKSTAGCFLRVDPIYSPDEKYLILATSRAVEVYSTETSLLVRKVTFSSLNTITRIAISQTYPDQIYAASQAGTVFKIDWLGGRIVHQWEISTAISHMVCMESPVSNQDVLITASNMPTQGFALSFHQVPDSDKTSTVKTRIIESPSEPVHALFAMPQGEAVFAATGDDLIMATLEPHQNPSKQGRLHAQSRRVRSSEPIVSISAMRSPSSDGIDLALGGLRNNIFIYADIFGQLSASSEDKSVNASLTPRRLNGHRSTVEAVKWSPDGNYIISGGHETTLFIWQLETGRRQTLRNLTSPILSISVAPSGKSYAVRLADNAIMTLSTADLTPRTYISGIQSRIMPVGQTRPCYETVTLQADDKEHPSQKFPTTSLLVDPRNPTNLLLTVPSHQIDENSDSIPPAPFLQTFDTYSNRHISRQALTRNNATTKDIGPSARKLKEPDVKFMQVSPDGIWLATVEEWSPPSDDVEVMADVEHDATEERSTRSETYLKFWERRDDSDDWNLVTIIDTPHQSITTQAANRVLDLTAAPSGHGFATVGEDALVRLWQPKNRYSKDLVLRGVKAETETQLIWSCVQEIELEKPTPHSDAVEESLTSQPLSTARLAYSDDGSVLAAGIEISGTKVHGLIHLIRPQTGEIIHTLPEAIRDGLAGLGIVSRRYLVALSRNLQVWDLVTNTMVYGFTLKVPSQFWDPKMSGLKHLAINRSNKTFAIALPAIRGKGSKHLLTDDIYSMILTFTPDSAYPLLSVDLPTLVTAVAPVEGSSTFVVLDAAAELRTIGLKADLRSIEAMLSSEVSANALVVGAEAEDRTDMPMVEAIDELEAEIEEKDAMDLDDDTDKPVVRQGQLAQALNKGPAFALPNVTELFDAVLQLYARPPKPLAAAS